MLESELVEGILRRFPRSHEARLKLATTSLRRWILLCSSESHDPESRSLATRVRALSHGFTSRAWSLYELDTNNPADYVPDYVDIDLAVRHPVRLALRDKLSFSYTMQALGVATPRVMGYIDNRRLREPGARDLRAWEPLSWLDETLDAERSLVFRPVDQGGGRGVFFLGKTEAGQYAINSQPVGRDTAGALLRSLRRYLVTEFVHQASWSRDLYPGTSNTLRVLTLWDHRTDSPFIAAAAQRVGTVKSGHLDNFHSGRGGMSVRIDVPTGRLGCGALVDRNQRVQRHRVHPDSGAQLEGLQIPDWDALRQQILQVAAAQPQYPYVGWDMIMGDERLYWLEGNAPPGLDPWQVHDPLLTDPRVRAFYRHHRML
jgi:hypothetical protein